MRLLNWGEFSLFKDMRDTVADGDIEGGVGESVGWDLFGGEFYRSFALAEALNFNFFGEALGGLFNGLGEVGFF